MPINLFSNKIVGEGAYGQCAPAILSTLSDETNNQLTDFSEKAV